MEQLLPSGRITHGPSSSFPARSIVETNEQAARRNSLMLGAEQCAYNRARRHIDLGVISACRAYGVGPIHWSPLGGGPLAGAHGLGLVSADGQTEDWATRGGVGRTSPPTAYTEWRPFDRGSVAH